jgi:hypothetical protein
VRASRCISRSANPERSPARQATMRSGSSGPQRLCQHTRSLCGKRPAQNEQWCCWIGCRRQRLLAAPVLPRRDPRLTLSRWVPETPPFELEERSGGVFVTTGPQPWRIFKTQQSQQATQGGGISPRAGDAVREQHPPTAAMSETMQGGAASPQDGLDSLTQPKTPAIGDTAATAIWISVTSWH